MRRALQAGMVVLLAAAAAAVVLATPPDSPERIIAALLLVLVLPGIPGSRLLRPSPAGLERLGSWPTVSVERLLLVPALSVAVVILDSAGLYVAGVRLDLNSWTLSLAAITVVLALVGLLPFGSRRPAARQGRRVRPPLMPRGRQALIAVPAALLVTAMLAGAGALTYASVRSRDRADRFTQLWLLPSTGAQRSAAIGVFNHEGRTVSYRLRIFANGQPLRSELVTVANGATWRSAQGYSASAAQLRVKLVGPGSARQMTVLHVYPPPPRPRVVHRARCSAGAHRRGRACGHGHRTRTRRSAK